MPFEHAIRSISSEEESPAIAARGDLDVAEGAHVHETIRAAGALRIGARALIEGSASASQAAEVGAGVRIAGTLLVAGPVQWGDAARAGRAAIRGTLTTSDGITRAESVLAARGIHSEGDPAVSR